MAVDGDELVHDAAIGADELVFGALAETGEHRAGVAGAGERENRESRGYLQGGGAGEAGAERDVAPETEAEAGDLVAIAGEDGNHAQRIVGPVAGAFGGEGCGVEAALLAVVLRVEDDLAVAARRDAGQGGEVDGRGHDEALGVVGMLADQVDPAGRGKDGRLGVETGAVHGTEVGRIMHCDLLPGMDSNTETRKADGSGNGGRTAGARRRGKVWARGKCFLHCLPSTYLIRPRRSRLRPRPDGSRSGPATPRVRAS